MYETEIREQEYANNCKTEVHQKFRKSYPIKRFMEKYIGIAFRREFRL